VSQIRAIVWLRFKLLMRRARSTTGVLNAISALLLALVGIVLSLGLAVGFGAMIALTSDDPLAAGLAYAIPLYTFLFFGVVVPVIRGAIEQGFDAKPFLVFPISRVRLYFVTLAAAFGGVEHIFYYPAMLAIAGVTLAVVGLSPLPFLLILLLIVVFYVAWGNTINLILTTVMRGRRVREYIAIIAVTLLLLVSIGPSLILDRENGYSVEGAPLLSAFLSVAGTAARVLPPTVAADGIVALGAGELGAAGLRIAALIVWNAVGIVLGYWIFTRYHLEPRTQTARRRSRIRRRRTDHRSPFDHPWLGAIPIETRAMASKELRYLLRSVVGRFVLFMVPIFAMLIGAVMTELFDEALFGIQPMTLLLFGVLLYSVMFSNNFLNNAFGWESDGIKVYFMSPVPLTRVILGKNLGIWLFNVVVLALLLVTWSLVAEVPGWLAVSSGVLLFWIVLITFTTSGNILSILFPIGRSVSSMMNSPSQTAIFLSFVSLSVGVGFVTLGLSLAWLVGLERLLPLFLLAILCGVIAIYAWTLRLAARLLDERKEKMIEALRVIK
jgi:hypothetical protein